MADRRSCIALALALCCTPGFAQTATPVAASAAYDAKDWKTCARLHGELADREVPPPTAQLMAARCLARAGEPAAALARLARTSHLNRPPLEAISTDPDLASLHDDPRWQAWLQTQRKEEAQRAASYDKALVQELKTRTDKDQAIREQAGVDPHNKDAWMQLQAIDQANTAWLKTVVDRQGWPRFSQVGVEGGEQAWLLAQHADADPAFQERVLALMQVAVSQDEASGAKLAYLTDRVRVAQGKPQLYGTQFVNRDGVLQPSPIEDIASVDDRRAAVGLGTMAEYIAIGEAQFKMKILWPPAEASR